MSSSDYVFCLIDFITISTHSRNPWQMCTSDEILTQLDGISVISDDELFHFLGYHYNWSSTAVHITIVCLVYNGMQATKTWKYGESVDFWRIHLSWQCRKSAWIVSILSPPPAVVFIFYDKSRQSSFHTDSQHAIYSLIILNDRVNGEDDTVAGLDVKVDNLAGARVGSDGDTLTEDVIHTPVDGDLSSSSIVKLGGS